jgi:hypothetical protein
LTSAPYAVRALNAAQLNGVAASQFVRETDTRLTDSRDPRAGSGNYIQNQNSSPQTSTNSTFPAVGRLTFSTRKANFKSAAAEFSAFPARQTLMSAATQARRTPAGAEFNSFFGQRRGLCQCDG